MKPKWKTTEFWFSLAAAVIGLLFASGVVETGSQFDKILGMGVMVLTTLGYSVQRGMVKAQLKPDKPGFKTTEFWMTAVSASVGTAIASGAFEGTPTEQAMGMATAALSTLGYGPARALAKRSSLLFIISLSLSGCITTSANKMAEKDTYKAVAPEYYEYIKADKSLTEPQKKRRYTLIYTWGDRVQEKRINHE